VSDPLRPMSEAEFAAWRPDSIRRYADEKVRSGAWDEASAPARAEAELSKLLPKGLATEDHHLFAVQDASGRSVGILWFARVDRAGVPVAYLYELAIWPAFRRQGHAERAMQAFEDQARTLGCRELALHVFGHNLQARRLYAKLGFAETNVNMSKPLAGP
jgi:ribosomal protein S18 acetylase RimI-like enzyme